MAEGRQGKGARRSRQEWRSLLAKLEGSGLGVGAFCRREAISAASLYRWRNLLNEGGAGGEAVVGKRAPAFVDLGTLSSTDARQARIEIKLDLGDGLVLHLVRG